MNNTVEILKDFVELAIDSSFTDWFVDKYKFVSDYVNSLWYDPSKSLDPYSDDVDFLNPIIHRQSIVFSIRDVIGFDVSQSVVDQLRELLGEELNDVSDEELRKAIRTVNGDGRFWDIINSHFWEGLEDTIKRHPDDFVKREYVYDWKSLKDNIINQIKQFDVSLFDLKDNEVRWIYFDFENGDVGITEKFSPNSFKSHSSYRSVLGGSYYVILLMEVVNEGKTSPQQLKDIYTDPEIIDEMIKHMKEVSIKVLKENKF